MKILRTVVFPIIWMILALIIAIALIRIAFFGSNDQEDSEIPSVSQIASTTVVTRADIVSQLEISGSVQRDPGISVFSPHSAEVNHIWVNNGDVVQRGTRLFQIKVPEQTEVETPVSIETEDGEVIEDTRLSTETIYRYYDVISPADGTLDKFTLRVGSNVEKDAVVAEITAGTFSITADLTPEQQFQLLDLELKAEAQVAGVKDPIACVGAKVGEKDKSEITNQPPPMDYPPDSYDGQRPEQSLATLTCPIPPGTKTVPGLSALIHIDTGSVTGVLAVPTTAVIDQITHGSVYAQDPQTLEMTEIQVELGLQGDGLVEIKSGLTEGQEILEFAPGVEGLDPYGFGPSTEEVY